MKKMFVAVSMVGVLAAAGVAMAQGWGRGPGYGPGPAGSGAGPGAGPGYGGGWCLNNLTPEQTQQMRDMREGFFQETQALRNEMQKKQLELRGLWGQANPDQAQILAKQKEINALRAQLQEQATQHRLEMRKILTPEQQAQMGAYGPGSGPGYGRRGGGFGPGRGMGFGNCPRW